MTRSFPATLGLALVAMLGFAACDAVPNATASAGSAETEPFELRDGMVVESDGDAVRLTVDGNRVTLRAIEMLALSQVAQRAAFDALTDEQRELYLSGQRVEPPTGGNGPRCYPDDSGFVFAKPRGGGDPCPPPPPMHFDAELAQLLYGDYFEIGEHPGEEADWRPAAGGLVYGR